MGLRRPVESTRKCDQRTVWGKTSKAMIPLKQVQCRTSAESDADDLQAPRKPLRTLAMTNAFDFDALVIGAGPAGSAAASFLRKSGLSVSIVEKETFPRFRIGESLLPNGNNLLKEIGVWP